MQTNLNKKSNFFGRLLQIIDYYGINSVNSFAKDCLGYTSSEKINRLKDENNNPSFEIITDISNKFENINIDWLITGRGDMLKNSKEYSNVEIRGRGNVVSDVGVVYYGNSKKTIQNQTKAEPTKDNQQSKIEELSKEVQSLRKENTHLCTIINVLEGQLKDKEKIIGLLASQKE